MAGNSFVSLWAVLMMKFARDAAQLLWNVEIIEYHHDQKKDALLVPLRTAEQLPGYPRSPYTHSQHTPSRSGAHHSDLGLAGQTLTVRHDSISREFMPGVQPNEHVSRWKL